MAEDQVKYGNVQGVNNCRQECLYIRLGFFSHFQHKWRMHDDLTCSAHVSKMTWNI
jgi:hypothetical protein